MSQAEITYYNFSCANLIPIKTEQIFNIGQLKITPIFTPAHTKGCICYLAENNLFTGDVLFNEGCGLCRGESSDPIKMFQRLNKIKNRVNINTTIYPGHSYGLPIGQKFSPVLKNNIYLNINNKNDFVNFRMRPNQKKEFLFS